MRIALLTYSTRPRGGVVHTLNLAEALAAAGADVSVHTLGRGGDAGFFRPVDPAVDVRILPFPDVPDESVGERILRSIEVLSTAEVSDADIVHAQDCISANAVADCIRTVHHIDQFTTPELVACHDRAIRRPTALVCVSESVAIELSQDWGLAAEVIPNGIESERFDRAAGDEPEAVSGRKRWQERIGGPFVLTVGGIEPRKGSVDLVDAMAVVRRRHPEVSLVIAGGETLFDYRPYRAAFDRRCDEVGVDPIVLGPVSHDELPSLVASCDAFAFPSTKEGFGLAAMEALAAGRPLVCRDLRVLREVFGRCASYGITGQELGTALIDALSAGRGAAEVEAGRRLARQHRWSDVADAHLSFYRSVAG